VGEESIGHVLVEKRGGVDEVEGNSVGSKIRHKTMSACTSNFVLKQFNMRVHRKKYKRGQEEGILVSCWDHARAFQLGSRGEDAEGEQRGTNIFIASNCSFFGMISSIWGASSGYVCTTCVRIARCTEDFTFDLEPGEMLKAFYQQRHT
jgi:hypothetical protein